MTKRLFAIDPWVLATSTLAKADKRLQESLTAIGNGYMGCRGNFEEHYSGDTHRGIYLAGVWFPDKTRVGWWKNGYPRYFGKVINAPDFLSIPIAINGVDIDLARVAYRDFHLTLDLHDGVLRRGYVVTVAGATVKLAFTRFMSNAVQQLALIRVQATVLEGAATIVLTPQLDGDVHNEDANYAETFWEPVVVGTNALTMVTKPNPFKTPRFTVTEMMANRIVASAPAVTRNLLTYRYDQLAGAYHNARQQGLQGALYPMVTFDGIECYNEWEITFEEIHRNASVAFAIYNYTDYTGDTDYVLTKGIDVLVGIARFWADRVHRSARTGQYMLHGVTGPNEYENYVNNNWYTNKMAVWCLRYTLEILPQVAAAKAQALAVSEAEQAHWQAIIKQMYLPEDKQLGIFVQNDGFLDKALRPAVTLRPEERPLNQHWSWDKILRSPFIKQADVLEACTTSTTSSPWRKKSATSTSTSR